MLGVEGEVLADLVDDDQVAALGGELRPPVREHIVGLGGEADDDLTGATSVRRDLGEDVGVADQRDRLRVDVVPFLSFASARLAGRKSATAAAITIASALAATSSTATRISSAVPTRTTFAPAGSASAAFAEINVTSAPRASAARASA